jgi:hypothetical protein
MEYWNGFETDVTILAAEGIILTAGPTISSAQAHQTISLAGGVRSLLMSAAAHSVRIPVKGTPGTKDIGFAVRFDTGSELNVDFDISLSTNCRVRISTDGFVRLYRGAGAVLLQTSAATLSAATWYWVKIAVSALEAGSGGRIQVFINGSTSAFVDTGAGVDCRAQTTDHFDTVFFDNGVNTNVYLDDYHQGTLGSFPNKQLYVWLNRPTAEHGTPDGTPSTGTDNALTIDEDPVNTGDYNELVGSGDRDMFTMSNPSFAPLEVVGIRTLFMATSEGSITQGKGVIESNGNVATGTNQSLSTGGAYSVVGDTFLLDPDGNVAWTGTKANAHKSGYEVT